MDDSKTLKEFILENLTDGKLQCQKAFEISDKTGASIKEIGKICNKEGIKISGCQLGCF
jgi:hypothetical protein